MASVGGVVDISSDEEYFPTGTKLPDEPLGWASDLFDVDVQDDAIGDNFDDLIVMSEWSSPPVQKAAKPDDIVVMDELSSPAVHQKKDKSGGVRDEQSKDDSDCLSEDDDCMVLDGDPDKAVTIGEEEAAGDSSSDELQIVAEKGPVACRDFPHSRHLCSNFPFNSTSHLKYCDKCHCFVCDIPAPCKYWGNGTSVTEHCHATDKEGRWKELRQALKGKPSFDPVKHQSIPCSTMMSPRQQNMHFHVGAPQALPSLPSNMRHHSLANQNPLLYGMSQNQQRNPSVRDQQRNPSVRVSLCLAGTVSARRAGRGIGSPHIPKNTHSHAIFKRAGSFPLSANRFGSAVTSDNSLMNQALPNVPQPFQVAPRMDTCTGTAQENAPQRSFSAPIPFQPQQGHVTTYGEVALNIRDVTGPQLSRCSSLVSKRTQCLEEPVIDVSTRSWKDILASVASDLGVPDYNIGTAESHQITADSGPAHSTGSQGLGLQHEPVAATSNLASSNAHGLLNNTIGSNVQSDGPLQTTESMHHLNCQSSTVPNDGYVTGGPADDFGVEEAARQLELSGLESNFLFKLDWD